MAQEDRDAKIQKILANPVYVDEIYPNYSALCSHFGMTAAKGKQRDYQKRLFRCFFDFDKETEHSNRIVITDTFFDDTKPYFSIVLYQPFVFDEYFCKPLHTYRYNVLLNTLSY